VSGLKVSSSLEFNVVVDGDQERSVIEILLRGFGRELDFASQDDLLSFDAQDMTVHDSSELDGLSSVSGDVKDDSGTF